MSMSREEQQVYWVWGSMIQRCYNSNVRLFRLYGGVGVSVCDEWKNSAAAFARDMGPRPPGYTIERKDSKGNYEPSNCCWASRDVQANNRDWCVYVEIEGERLSMKQAWRKYAIAGLSYRVFMKRIRRGYLLMEAINQPLWKSGDPRRKLESRKYFRGLNQVNPIEPSAQESA